MLGDVFLRIPSGGPPAADDTPGGEPCSPNRQETVQLSLRAAGAPAPTRAPALGNAALAQSYNPPRRACALPVSRRPPLAELGPPSGGRAALPVGGSDVGGTTVGASAGGGALAGGTGAGKQADAAGGPGAPEEDPDETVPLVNGGLARRALRGRQSIAPGVVRAAPPLLPCISSHFVRNHQAESCSLRQSWVVGWGRTGFCAALLRLLLSQLFSLKMVTNP